MEQTAIQTVYKAHRGVKAVSAFIRQNNEPLYLTGLAGSSGSVVISTIFSESDEHFLCILNDAEEAGYFFHDCSQVLNNKNVLFFPSGYKRSIRYGQKDVANEILRTEVLSKLSNEEGKYLIVTYPEALIEKVVSSEKLEKKTLNINKSEKIDTGFIEEVLHSYGFERVDYVYEPGQYARRGSIIDVFSFSHELPYRVDFFGDEVESIRTFNVETQLSEEQLDAISIVSATSGEKDISLLSYFEEGNKLVFKSEKWIYDRLNGIWDEEPVIVNEDTFSTLEEIRTFLTPPTTLREQVNHFAKILLENPPISQDCEERYNVIPFSTEMQISYKKNFEMVAASFKEKINEGYTIYILSDNEKQIARIRSIFDDRGDNITFVPVLHTIHEGYTDNDLRVCLFTDHQLFDRYHKYNLKSEYVRSGKIALSLKELQQFQMGDYVVHIDHGVGRFAGLVRSELNGKIQEMIKLIFLNDDIIYVSIHALHKISKYKGRDSEAPRLNKIGSKTWDTLKDKTKKKVKDIAKDLIILYSKRKARKGFAYSPDSYLQKELEASFTYEDTPDQLKATNDIKMDMESKRPMDRLVCGDVGFGKTEVAIRAAFKAVADNKQVAVLVPTTLLAYQHYHTFKNRLKDFPANVEYLSRARTHKGAKEVLKGIEDGRVDILIGTHRLVSADVKFKDLGLLIIDEEQKFGVTVKERLKHLKTNVDTLTLTATPIPRTLQFSLMGARDLSNITTPPPNRHPIQTEVHRFSNDIVREAVNFEMSRNGQVFIINNRVDTLEKLANIVIEEVPDARVAIGHGQMDSGKLEKIITDFANYEYDVLVATTIVENGIDISNANTIIINDAQNFGLGDLHQLRGRVGRSNRKAFCYLLSPPLNLMSSEARRRLQAIENYSGLGSGIHIALQDLDIRGAGNMLGAEQSGFITEMGYETYQKILAEAVQELKNEEFSDLYKDKNKRDSGQMYVAETTVESDMELLFPATYIPSDSERILLYRELDSMSKKDDIDAFREKIRDRFGPIPYQSEELICIVSLRQIAKKLGIEKVILRRGEMGLQLVSQLESTYYQSEAFDKLLKYAKNHPQETRLKEKNHRRSLLINNVDSVGKAINILEEIKYK